MFKLENSPDMDTQKKKEKKTEKVHSLCPVSLVFQLGGQKLQKCNRDAVGDQRLDRSCSWSWPKIPCGCCLLLIVGTAAFQQRTAIANCKLQLRTTCQIGVTILQILQRYCSQQLPTGIFQLRDKQITYELSIALKQ